MITLYHFNQVFGFDPSPFVVKMQAYLSLAGLPFEMKRADLRKAPKGQLPYISDNGKLVADTRFIIDYLKATYGDPLDGHLAAAEKANLHAWQRMVEEHLYWVLVYSRWIDDAGWRVFAPMVFGLLPAPLRLVVPPLIRKCVYRTLHGQGTVRHSPDEIYTLGRRDLEALATLLGDRLFMFGDKPTSLDATATGFLVNILQAPIESRLKADAAKHANLVTYAERMRKMLKG